MLVRAFLNQKTCGTDHVARDHDPVGPGVRAERAVEEGEHFVRVAAVPRGEELGGIGVADHRARHEHDLRHEIEVAERDDVLEMEDLAADHHERQHHGEPRKDRAGDEVRREDRRVPARKQRDGEVHRHDRMDREDQRRRQRRENEVRGLVVMPLPLRAAPSERHETVDELPHRRLRPIANCRQVRDEADVPEQERDRAVDADREDVPEQRTPEVWPHPHLVRQREHPVGDPDAAHMDPRERHGAHDREDRHRFRRAVDRGAPALAEEEEDRGDQGAGVADADPEHEVRDVPRPANRNVEAPDPDPLPEQPRHGHAEQAEEREGRKEKHPPADRRRPLERLGDDVGDGVEVRRAQDQRRTAYDRVVEQFCFRVRHACSRSLVLLRRGRLDHPLARVKQP